MTTDNKHTIQAKYLFAMGNGDIFEGNLNVRFDEEPTQDMWSEWWNTLGNDFIVDCAQDAVEKLGVEGEQAIAFVLVTPNNEKLQKIVQSCSNPVDWADQSVDAWEYLTEQAIVPSLSEIAAAYKPPLRLVWGMGDEEESEDLI